MVFDALQNLAATNSARKADASDSAACDSEAEAAPAPAATVNNKRKKRPLDQIIEALPVSEVIIDPPEVWTCMGAEVTKLIDYLPGRFECQQLFDRKFARTETCHLPPITAPLLTWQVRCIATPRLLGV
jgi:hypothetical protein